jgi:hypothetical protein
VRGAADVMRVRELAQLRTGQFCPLKAIARAPTLERTIGDVWSVQEDVTAMHRTLPKIPTRG